MADRRLKRLEARLRRERAERERLEAELCRLRTEAAAAAPLQDGHLGNLPGMICRRILRPDGTVEFPFVSGDITEILGISSETIRSKPDYLLRCIHPEDLDRYTAEYAQSAKGMTPLRLVVRVRSREGGYAWVRISANPRRLEDGSVVWDVVATDVTEAKQATEELKVSEANYRQTFERLPTPLYIHIDGKLVFANEAACAAFGAETMNDLIGFPELKLFASEMHEEVMRRRELIATDGVSAGPMLDSWLIRLDGRPFFGETVGTSIQWDDKPAVLVVIHDITERKQAERLNDAARRAAEDANRAKSDFLASMSHELRTPLNGVLGTANLLLDGRLDKEQHERVEVIRQSGGALLSLLNDILDISKVESGRLELEDLDFALKDLLNTVADLWAPQAESKGIAFLRDEGAVSFPVLRSDPARIRQILFNLISNALKFTDEGSITVRVGQKQKSGGFIETTIEIIDTGTGIPPDRVDRIFEKFVQADSSITRRYGGSGLGLSLCKSFAAALNGNIGVKSKLGEGSTFWFRIICPTGDADKVQAELRDDILDGEDGDRTVRILVAEDNKINQTVIVAMLQRAGHHVDVVNNGLEAFSAVMRAPYDVILMDVQMPEMDGITATRKIRELEGERGDVPIIALTANAMVGDREQYLEAGMTDYVSKPIEPTKLANAIRRQCGTDVAVKLIGQTTTPTAEAPEADPEELQEYLDKLFELF
jgi:PAS domain S-box-containing protein